MAVFGVRGGASSCCAGSSCSRDTRRAAELMVGVYASRASGSASCLVSTWWLRAECGRPCGELLEEAECILEKAPGGGGARLLLLGEAEAAAPPLPPPPLPAACSTCGGTLCGVPTAASPPWSSLRYWRRAAVALVGVAAEDSGVTTSACWPSCCCCSCCIFFSSRRWRRRSRRFRRRSARLAAASGSSSSPSPPLSPPSSLPTPSPSSCLCCPWNLCLSKALDAPGPSCVRLSQPRSSCRCSATEASCCCRSLGSCFLCLRLWRLRCPPCATLDGGDSCRPPSWSWARAEAAAPLSSLGATEAYRDAAVASAPSAPVAPSNALALPW